MGRRVLSYKEYVDLRLTEFEKRNDAIRALMSGAIHDREREMERRLAFLNELRGEVIADRQLFVPKVEFDSLAIRVNATLDRTYYEEQHKALGEKVDRNIADLATLRTEISNVRSRNAGLGTALGVALTLVTIIMIILSFVNGHP